MRFIFECGFCREPYQEDRIKAWTEWPWKGEAVGEEPEQKFIAPHNNKKKLNLIP